jgi:hypothetical protein
VEAVEASSVVLGMRLHSLVVGARAGRALVALAYDPKVTATMRMLGAGGRSLDLVALTGTTLADALEAAWRRRAEIGAQQSVAVADLAARARTNATRLLGLVDAPPPPRPEDPGLALLKRSTLRLAVAADGVNQKAEDERRRLQARAEYAEAAVQRWETSTAGSMMRLWRRWRR